MTNDTWHMTYDTWHMTHDMWHMTGGGEFGSEGVLKMFPQMITDWLTQMRDEGVCRTAPAKPGLLTILQLILSHYVYE